MKPSKVKPELPEGATPLQKLKRYAEKHKKPKNFAMNVQWARETIQLNMSSTMLVHAGGGKGEVNTYTIHTTEKSKIGTPIVSMTLGVWHDAAAVAAQDAKEFDEKTVKVRCIAANSNRRGNEVVALVKDLARWLGAKRVMLIDGSFVTCSTGEPYDLALFMMMKNGETWYQKQGFAPVANRNYEGVLPELAAKRTRAEAEKMRKVTVKEVYDDASRALKALEWVVAKRNFEVIHYDQPRLWKRDGVVEKHSAHFVVDLARTVYTARGLLSTLLRNLKLIGAPASKSFAAVLVALQKTNCSLFNDIYIQLFDNEIYNWRHPLSAFNFEILEGAAKGKYRHRILEPVLRLALLVGGGEEISAWMVWEVKKEN